jgi:hypothetical protein
LTRSGPTTGYADMNADPNDDDDDDDDANNGEQGRTYDHASDGHRGPAQATYDNGELEAVYGEADEPTAQRSLPPVASARVPSIADEHVYGDVDNYANNSQGQPIYADPTEENIYEAE